MSWNSNQWSGSYWGAKGRRAKNQSPATGKCKGSSKSKEGKKQGEKAFPKYDAMPVDASGSLPSSSRSPPAEDAMQKAMLCLIKNNPSLKVPKEISDVLEGASEILSVEARNEIHEQQRSLNKRRKASQRVDRIKEALKRKQLQFVAYQDQLKIQLRAELDRYTKEKKELEEQLSNARSNLEKLENGEDPAEEDPGHVVDVTDNSLAEMLGLGVSPQLESEMEQLKQDKMYAEMRAQHLQQQLIADGNDPQWQKQRVGPDHAIYPQKRSPQLPLPGSKKQKSSEVESIVIDSPDVQNSLAAPDK